MHTIDLNYPKYPNFNYIALKFVLNCYKGLNLTLPKNIISQF